MNERITKWTWACAGLIVIAVCVMALNAACAWNSI